MAKIQPYKRSDGGVSYRVRWVIGGGRYAPGKDTGSETFTSEAKALSFKEDVEAAGHQWPKGWVKGAGYVQPDEVEESPSFKLVAQSYFDHQTRRMNRNLIKPYTLHRDRRCYDLHLAPLFDDQSFLTIGHEDVEDWVDGQLEIGASAKSIRNRHGLLFSIMAHGQKRLELRPTNPCEVTELPQIDHVEARQIRFFQEGEWSLFRACLKEDVHLLVDVLLVTGMRWGEISALRVEDVSYVDNGDVVLHIRRAWSKRAPNDQDSMNESAWENRSWKLGPPKNRRSRYVTLSGEIADRFIASIEGQAKSAYAFHTRSGCPWRYPDFHYDRWLPARREATELGLDKHATPHMLRHSFVVWSLAEGMRIEKVSEYVGHRSIQITYDIYGGMIDLKDPEAAQVMARALLRVTQAITPARRRKAG